MAILLDNVLQISISKLKKWGYLTPNQVKTGSISWSRNDRKIGSISIKADMRFCYNDLDHSEFSYIELEYNCNKERVKYQIPLVSLPSNIGKGRILYFKCPDTGKRCRKLYLVGKRFLHREAFKGCMYSTQIESKLDRLSRLVFRTTDKLFEQEYSRYFKKTYNGKTTKKYSRLIEKITRAQIAEARGLKQLSFILKI